MRPLVASTCKRITSALRLLKETDQRMNGISQLQNW